MTKATGQSRSSLVYTADLFKEAKANCKFFGKTKTDAIFCCQFFLWIFIIGASTLSKIIKYRIS